MRLLLLDGQPEKALRMCEAAAESLRLCAWLVFNGYTVFAIDIGQFDWAYKAAQIQLKRQPGYEVQFLNQAGRMEKLRTDPKFDRWKPILAAAEKKAEDRRKSEKTAMPPLPPWGDTQLVERRLLPPEKLTSHRVPRGGVMSLSTQGGPLLAVLRDKNTYFLWPVGVADPVEMKGLPPLVPPRQIQGYVMRPSIAWFEDKVWIGAEHLGLFVVDPASGRTEQVKDGFPDGSVHALAVEDKFLFAAGGGQEAGFIARREAGTAEWKTWMAPPFCGPVRRIAGMPRPRPGPVYHVETPFGRMQMVPTESLGHWPIYHVESQRLSEFEWKTGQWSKGRSVEKYCFQPSCAAACGRWVLFFETGRHTQDPMYMATWGNSYDDMLAVFFPPANLSEYSAILDRHTAAWSMDRQLRATMAPLADHPVDVVTVDDCFWILDTAGGLTAMRDAQSFAGPYMVARRAQAMCATAESLAVVAGREVILVPRELLAGKLAEAGAWRSAADVEAEVAARLKAWIEARPPEEQVAYFIRIRRPDLGAAVIAAHPELDPALVLRTARERASLLIMEDKHAEALAVIEPYCRTPRDVIDNGLYWYYLWALNGTKQWQTILEVAPQLWLLVSPGDRFREQTMLSPYFHALRATTSKDEFEKILWQHIRLERPIVTWGWDDNEVTKQHAWYVRYVTGGWLRELLKQQGRLKEIEGNPLIPEE